MKNKLMSFELTKKETKRILNEIKKKKIEDMEIFDLIFIIENDDTLLSIERLDYEAALFRKMLLNQ
jgi:hypothetical protein